MRVPFQRSIRHAFLLSGAFVSCAIFAQKDRGSLTDQFPGMSAKERSRIAAKEAEEAQKDANYQDVMRAAELSFQEGRYEEAISGYEQARALRPYNVYPKVKIEDLRALIAKQAAEKDTTSIVEEHPVEQESAAVPQAISPEPIVSGQVRADLAPRVTPTAPAPVPVVDLAEERISSPPPTPSFAKAAEGIIEQRYREGHAFVIERAVTIDGRLVKYKRVYHPHGQTFYFEDGFSVDERVWKARFPGR